jgi:hypothetical protein
MKQFLILIATFFIVYGGIILLHLNAIKEHLTKPSAPPTLSKHVDHYLTERTDK